MRSSCVSRVSYVSASRQPIDQMQLFAYTKTQLRRHVDAGLTLALTLANDSDS